MLDASYGLIFGGCCANVFALEAIVKYEPDSGLLITVIQFLVVTLFALPSQLQSSSSWPRLKPTSIPIERLSIMALLFFTVNMMNNWAFAFDISVPMHIILRSFGSVQTLAIGWLWGKKYSSVQVGSVLALTVGVVISAWADAIAKGAEMDIVPAFSWSKSSEAANPTTSFVSGLVVLFTAQLLSAFMGIYTENVYAMNGRHWRENLFYSHLLGLIFSAALAPTIVTQLSRLAAGPRITFPYLSHLLPWLSTYLRGGRLPWQQPADSAWNPAAQATLPRALLLLGLNAATQVVCISGVNRLSARTTAVTVTVVLNIRKLVSFLLSCAIFGNPVSTQMAVGAAIVFASGAVYGWDSSVSKSSSKGETAAGTKRGTARKADESANGSTMAAANGPGVNRASRRKQ